MYYNYTKERKCLSKQLLKVPVNKSVKIPVIISVFNTLEYSVKFSV